MELNTGEIIKTSKDGLIFRLNPEHEVGMGGPLFGQLIKLENDAQKTIDGIYRNIFTHSINSNHIGLANWGFNSLGKQNLAILDYENCSIRIFKFPYFSEFSTLSDEIICCRSIRYGKDSKREEKEIKAKLNELELIKKIQYSH